MQDSRESTKAYFITRTQPNVWICSTWKWMFKITSAVNISWPRLWSFTIFDCQGASKWFNSGKSVISSLSNLFPGEICCHIGAVAFDLYHYTVILEQKIGLQLHIRSQVINWICWLIPTAYIFFFNIKAVITYMIPFFRPSVEYLLQKCGLLSDNGMLSIRGGVIIWICWFILYQQTASNGCYIKINILYASITICLFCQ